MRNIILHRLWWTALFSLGACLACGGRAENESANPSSGGATPNLISGSGGSAAGGTSGSGAGGKLINNASCDEVAHRPSPASLQVKVRNDRVTPVYLGVRTQCAPDESVGVKYESEYVTPLRPAGASDGPDFGCSSMCDDVVERGSISCDSAPAAEPPCFEVDAEEILPGEEVTHAWDMLTLAWSEIPASCGIIGDDPHCNQIVPVGSGNYSAIATAGTATTCQARLCSGCSLAECPGQSLVTGEELEAQLNFFVSENYLVYPEGTDPAAGPSGAAEIVELVFED